MEPTKAIVKYNTADASRLDTEMHQLVTIYSAARIKVGLEIGKRLKEINDNKLYVKLDDAAYPTFLRYIDSLGIKYATARELISLYECFVLVGGFDIDELATIPYHKLTTIKPFLFRKENGEYMMNKNKTEIKKWLGDAKSDITIEDLAQKRRESEVGEHAHEFEEIRIRVCKVCRLRERI